MEQAINRDPHYGWAALCCLRLCMDGSGRDAEADSGNGVGFVPRALEVAGDDPSVVALIAARLPAGAGSGARDQGCRIKLVVGQPVPTQVNAALASTLPNRHPRSTAQRPAHRSAPMGGGTSWCRRRGVLQPW